MIANNILINIQLTQNFLCPLSLEKFFFPFFEEPKLSRTNLDCFYLNEICISILAKDILNISND